MSTVELIAQKASHLPPDLQTETLRFVDFLLTRLDETVEARHWTRFSAEQLAAQYSERDAVYDQD
jgi:hypothetical protein